MSALKIKEERKSKRERYEVNERECVCVFVRLLSVCVREIERKSK